MTPLAAQPDLEKHLWKERVLLVFAPDPSDLQYQRQLNALMAEQQALRERKGVVYGIWKNTYRREINTGMMQKRPAGPLMGMDPEAGFGLVLIGLDGGIKERSSSFVPPEKLWALIDTMPMRRAEIRNKEN